MFCKLLQKLVAEYGGQMSYMGGDVDRDLVDALVYKFADQRDVESNRHTKHALGYIRVLYDLGVLVALESPADGEVKVDVALAQKILRIVNRHRVEHLRVCKRCKKDVGPDVVKLVEPVWRTCAGGNPYRNVYAFCPDCAAAAGPEWVKR
ncbi:MAG: hypothetical protein M0R22_00380 [Dehalococcoidia bacterium]|jgi:hypothetical protein|nr:hypothetical protein [Dehalococcoidia bacterium]